MNYPEVAVVILNWNGRKYLEQFLPFLLQSGYPNMRLIVGDNASTDDSVEFLKTHYPEVEIISNDQNYGFAGGYNQVLKQVDSPYFVLLNSDVEVSQGWIEPVIAAMEADPMVAAAQPKIRSQKEKHLFEHAGAAGGFIDQFGYPFCRGRIFDAVEEDKGQYDEQKEVFWVSGAALFIRRSCWLESGGFDPLFFAHMEEIDLCWRLQHLGYRLLCVPESVVYHVGGGTLATENPRKTYLNFRNNLFMLYKNTPASKVYFLIAFRFVLDFISLLKFSFDGKWANAREISRAHVDFLKMRNQLQPVMKPLPVAKLKGYFPKSIVWEYFIRGKKKFSEL